jgi:hypothetical protein
VKKDQRKIQVMRGKYVAGFAGSFDDVLSAAGIYFEQHPEAKEVSKALASRKVVGSYS